MGPSVLTPTLLFSRKETAVHFLNLLGFPVTNPPGLLKRKVCITSAYGVPQWGSAGPPTPELETAMDTPDLPPACKELTSDGERQHRTDQDLKKVFPGSSKYQEDKPGKRW